MKLWNIDTGELIYTAIASPDGKSLVWTPEGYFAGDEELARKAVYIVDGLTTYSIDQFFDVFYRPDIIAAKAAGEDLSDVTGPSISELMRRDGSPPEVEFVTESGTSGLRDVTLKMKVYDTGGGVGKVTVFLDGMPVTISDGRRGLKAVNKPAGSSVKAAYAYEALVSLRYGSNNIEVSAYNKSNTIESAKASVELVYKQRTVTKPDLHILAVAINKYRDRALWLNYSVNDANAITEAIPQKARSLYRQVKVYKLYDNEVTEEKLNAQFDTIAGSVKPDDVFVFYLAGHGITNDTDGDYYYLPADFRYTGSEAIASGGISKNDILENLIKIPAQKTVLFFDTCNSGSFIETPASRGLTEKTAVDRLKKAIGRAIIVASSESQVALEGMEDHGVFTYSLLRGLEGAADMNNDRFITLSELSVYIENDVPELTYEKWGYEQIPQKQLPKEDFPLVGR
jgi:hypothetical protein